MSIKRSNLFSLRDNRIQFFSSAWNLSTDHKHFSPFATNNGPVFIIKTKCMCCNTGFKSWSWNMLSSLGDIIFLLPFSIFLQNPHDIAIWLMRRIIEVENCHFPQEISFFPQSYRRLFDFYYSGFQNTHAQPSECLQSILIATGLGELRLYLNIKVSGPHKQCLWPHN